MAGADRSCADIQANIDNDLLQVQALERQKARTRDGARVAQIQQQIEQLRQEIAALEQEAQDLNCL